MKAPATKVHSQALALACLVGDSSSPSTGCDGSASANSWYGAATACAATPCNLITQPALAGMLKTPHRNEAVRRLLWR